MPWTERRKGGACFQPPTQNKRAQRPAFRVRTGRMFALRGGSGGRLEARPSFTRPSTMSRENENAAPGIQTRRVQFYGCLFSGRLLTGWLPASGRLIAGPARTSRTTGAAWRTPGLEFLQRQFAVGILVHFLKSLFGLRRIALPARASLEFLKAHRAIRVAVELLKSLFGIRTLPSAGTTGTTGTARASRTTGRRAWRFVFCQCEGTSESQRAQCRNEVFHVFRFV